MAYRNADPPKTTAEEEELNKLAAQGRRVKEGQAKAARNAARALEVSSKANELVQEKGRLRSLGRRGRPASAAIIISIVITLATILGGYLLYNSSLHVAIWVHILIWGVSLPSAIPAVFLERRLALHRGRHYEAQEQEWIDSQSFPILGLPFARLDRSGRVRCALNFKNRKPEPQLVADALRAVSADVLVEVVGLLGEEAPNDMDDLLGASRGLPPPPPSLAAALGASDEPESLSDLRAQKMLSAAGGGFKLVVRHRKSHYAEHWLEDWTKEAMASAFDTIHRAFPIESIEFDD